MVTTMYLPVWGPYIDFQVQGILLIYLPTFWRTYGGGYLSQHKGSSALRKPEPAKEIPIAPEIEIGNSFSNPVCPGLHDDPKFDKVVVFIVRRKVIVVKHILMMNFWSREEANVLDYAKQIRISQKYT